MSSNQQRRDAAKRKLQRQNERRAHQSQAMKQKLMIIGVIVAVAAVAFAVYLFTGQGSAPSNTAAPASGKDLGGTSDSAQDQYATESGEASTDTATITGEPTLATESASPGTVTCTYPADRAASKPVQPPSEANPPTSGMALATVTLNSGTVTAELDRAATPCTVNSFASLAAQHYFDDTQCHRLTSSPSLSVLQCGDPTATGTGGPGYTFADELSGSETYGAGTLAMANAGPNTNGSQFFIVYADSQLPPSYTVFGHITGGLDVVQAIAAKGAQGGGQDGAPVDPVTIESVTVTG